MSTQTTRLSLQFCSAIDCVVPQAAAYVHDANDRNISCTNKPKQKTHTENVFTDFEFEFGALETRLAFRFFFFLFAVTVCRLMCQLLQMTAINV